MANQEENEAGWKKELVAVEQWIGSDERLGFIRTLFSTLLDRNIEEHVSFYDLIESIEQQMEKELVPSVWYQVLKSIGYPKERLSAIEKYVTTPYDLRNKIDFDLMLALTETVRQMNESDFDSYKLQAGRPSVASKVEFLHTLYMNGALVGQNAPAEFRSFIQDIGCVALHQPLTSCCERHNIQVPVIEVPDFVDIPKKQNRVTIAIIVCFFIVLLIPLNFGAGLTFYIAYKNSHGVHSENVTVHKDYPTSSEKYDNYYYNGVDLSCPSCTSSSSFANVYVLSESNKLPIDPVVIQRQVLSERTVSSKQRFYLQNLTDTLICNPGGELSFEFDIRRNGNSTDCPAQLYLFDNKDDINSFTRNEHQGYPGDIPSADTTGCLNITGNMKKNFTLAPNEFYYIGLYVNKVMYTIWLSAKLSRINTNGLTPKCCIGSACHLTCPSPIKFSSSHPAHHENNTLVFNATTEGMVINIEGVLAHWNATRLSGVSIFWSSIGVIVFILLIIICIVFYRRKTSSNKGYKVIT